MKHKLLILVILLITATGCGKTVKNNPVATPITPNVTSENSNQIKKNAIENRIPDNFEAEKIEQDGVIAFTKNEGRFNYVIIKKDGVETVVDKAPDDPKNDLSKYLRFFELEFSHNSKYLKYKASGWEWMLGRVYDIEKNKEILSINLPSFFEFSNDSQYLFACTANDFGGEYYAKIYKTPNFEVYKDVKLNLTSLPIDIECNYQKDENVFVVSQRDNEKNKKVEIERVEL